MTIGEAITRVDALIPNQYTEEEKIRWLSDLDGLIKKTVIDKYEIGQEMDYEGYNTDTPMTTVLLVPHPFDEVYIDWMESKIYYYNGEYGKYNNAVMRYNDIMTEYSTDFGRNNTYAGAQFSYF